MTFIQTWDVTTGENAENGRVWELKPQVWNTQLNDDKKFLIIGTTISKTCPPAVVYFCETGETPRLNGNGMFQIQNPTLTPGSGGVGGAEKKETEDERRRRIQEEQKALERAEEQRKEQERIDREREKAMRKEREQQEKEEREKNALTRPHTHGHMSTHAPAHTTQRYV